MTRDIDDSSENVLYDWSGPEEPAGEEPSPPWGRATVVEPAAAEEQDAGATAAAVVEPAAAEEQDAGATAAAAVVRESEAAEPEADESETAEPEQVEVADDASPAAAEAEPRPASLEPTRSPVADEAAEEVRPGSSAEPEPARFSVAAEAVEEAEIDVPPAAPEELPGEDESEESPAFASAEHAGGELRVPDGYTVLEGVADGARRAVAVVAARFNGDVTSRLLERALDELETAGVRKDAVTVLVVPGAFELPLAATALAKTRRYACIVALGCVIRGDTPHFDYVASEAASGLQLAALETGVPVSFGVLTLDRADQADARIEKGAEAVRSALEMADAFSHLRAAAGGR